MFTNPPAQFTLKSSTHLPLCHD